MSMSESANLACCVSQSFFCFSAFECVNDTVIIMFCVLTSMIMSDEIRDKTIQYY